MSGKNSKAISISFRVPEGVVEHNNRDFIAKNVDKERIGNNITFYESKIFSPANKMQNEWAAWEEREQIVATEILRVHEYKHVAKK